MATWIGKCVIYLCIFFSHLLAIDFTLLLFVVCINNWKKRTKALQCICEIITYNLMSLYIFYPKSENDYDIPQCIFYSLFCIALRECLYAISLCIGEKEKKTVTIHKEIRNRNIVNYLNMI